MGYLIHGIGVLLALTAGAGVDRVARLTPPPPAVEAGWIDEESRARCFHTIETYSRIYRLDPKFIHAVVAVESNYNPRAVSRKGARGLMQLMPATAERYRVGDTFHPAQNIAGGTRHMRYLLDRYRGNLELTLAAYNAGETVVEKYGGVPPFSETESYVRKVLELYYRSAKPPKERWFRYEDERGRFCISNAVPADARNISPVVFPRGANF